MKETKVAPKPKKKLNTNKKPSVEMVTYSIKMTIPTGQYANIVPEIVVRGGSIEEAHNFIAPHMNKMWKEYYLVNERRPFQAPQGDTTAQHIHIPLDQTSYPNDTYTTTTFKPTTGNNVAVETPPASSVALIKATNAIESCLSIDALDIIANQVNVSVKLTDEDKAKLMPLIDAKYAELNNKNEQIDTPQTSSVVEPA